MRGRVTGVRELYLAGPAVFLADARAVGARRRALCAAHGFEGLFPLDDDVPAREPTARSIHDACMALLRRSDGVVADLTPFRGISADVGTVYEVAYALALGLPVFAYTGAPAPARDPASVPHSGREPTPPTPGMA